jgi:hypothetical protein
MAWPKLRSRKSPGQLVTVNSRSGASPDGERAHGAVPEGAGGAWTQSHAPDPSAPAPWPGGDIASDESSPDVPETSVSVSVSASAEATDVPFWDWAPSEDPAAAEDRPQDGAAASADPPKSTWKLVVRPAEQADEQSRPPGIGERRGSLTHLSANPRMRAWQWRVVIAIIVGVGLGIGVSWRLGLTLAVIVIIADTIYRSRRGLPGAKLTRAQRHTRRQLAKLGRAGYRAMHGNLIPQSEEQIDHLVVGPAGVFAIDSESWDKRLAVRTKNARQLWHGPFSMKERLEHARWESQRAAELLSGAVGSPVTVRPAMAVYGPKIPWDVATIRDVDVFSGPRLRKYLRRRARQNGVQPLSDAEVQRIYEAANQAFPHLKVGVKAGRAAN